MIAKDVKFLKVGEVDTILNVLVTNAKRKFPSLVSGILGSKFSTLSRRVIYSGVIRLLCHLMYFYNKWTNWLLRELLLETILCNTNVSIWLPPLSFSFYVHLLAPPPPNTLHPCNQAHLDFIIGLSHTVNQLHSDSQPLLDPPDVSHKPTAIQIIVLCQSKAL